MATATNVHLNPVEDVGVYSSGIREDAARVASKILQEDMESHHVFFNDEGFHSMFIPIYRGLAEELAFHT
jgi:hypothetical protein